MLVLYAATKNRIHLILVALLVGYVFIILPGWNRGYYPGLLLLLISLNLSSKEILFENNNLRYIPFLILSLLLLFVCTNFLRSTYSSYKQLNLVSEEIKPILVSYQINRAEYIFSDDFDLYIYGLDSESYKMCNVGGWTILHPYFSSYEVGRVMRGDENKYCNVKALIIKDKFIANKLLSTYTFRDVVGVSGYTIFIK